MNYLILILPIILMLVIIWKTLLVTQKNYSEKIIEFTKLISIICFANGIISFFTIIFEGIMPIPTRFSFPLLTTIIYIIDILVFGTIYSIICLSNQKKIINISIFTCWLLIFTLNSLYIIHIIYFSHQNRQYEILSSFEQNNMLTIKPHYDKVDYLNNILVPIIWIFISIRLLIFRSKNKLNI